MHATSLSRMRELGFEGLCRSELAAKLNHYVGEDDVVPAEDPLILANVQIEVVSTLPVAIPSDTVGIADARAAEDTYDSMAQLRRSSCTCMHDFFGKLAG